VAKSLRECMPEGSLAQFCLHGAHCLENRGIADLGQHPKATHRVGRGYPIRGFANMLAMHDLGERRREPLFQPTLHRRDHGFVFLELLASDTAK